MNNEGLIRLRGFKNLLHDGIRRGADFVEKHHRISSEKPFRVLESIRPIAAPSKTVHTIHDGILSLTYGGIRAINRAAEVADGWLINKLESKNRSGNRWIPLPITSNVDRPIVVSRSPASSMAGLMRGPNRSFLFLAS